MAFRPAWNIKNNQVIMRMFEVKWNPGFAIIQKKKNIINLHQSIHDQFKNENILEVSTKSNDEIGFKLSAFNLTLNGIKIENIFQAAKKYEKGGPYLDLLYVTPVEAKRDIRHKTSGKLVSFIMDSIEWKTQPLTSFYDYIYIRAALESITDAELNQILKYQWFTDIEFNPFGSINCQARSVALLKIIILNNFQDVLKNNDTWIKFHIEFVRDINMEEGLMSWQKFQKQNQKN